MRERIIVSAGNGLKHIPASTAAKQKLLQAGDVLGFYIPATSSEVIAMDYDNIAPFLDPYYYPGGSGWAEGEYVTLTGITFKRDYSLYADLDPMP